MVKTRPGKGGAGHRQYLVRKTGGAWCVKANGADSEPYKDRAAALRAAVASAHESGKNGQPAQVIGETDQGGFQVEWVYGRDPAPANA
jgi:hypothetical protein